MPDWSVGSTRRRPEADRLNIETASKQRRGGNGKGLQIRFVLNSDKGGGGVNYCLQLIFPFSLCSVEIKLSAFLIISHN